MKKARGEIRILIADDHAMLREAVRSMVDQEPDLRVVGEAANGREALDQVRKLAPEILLLNLMLPYSGIEVLQSLARDVSPVRTIIMVGQAESQSVVQALRLGARGVVCQKTPASLLFKGIRAVASGEYWIGHEDIRELIDCIKSPAAPNGNSIGSNGFRLTAREIQIVALIVDGYANKDIARKFSISEQTVKHHITSILKKVGVSNRLELALFAMHHSVQ
jgi:two-component system nitrate/nitrite response regulator NarL